MKVAIASGKGGTGKTTLSTNLAAFMSEAGQVILADLDVEEPNSGLFIKGELIHQEDKYKMIPEWDKTRCELCGNCQTVCNYNAVLKIADAIMVFPELCHGCYACSELCPTGSLPMKQKKMGELRSFRKDNLSLVESRLIIGEEQAVPLIRQTIDFVNANFSDDVTKIFDSPPGTSCPVIEATKDADLIILITEPTPFGLHDLKLAVETIRQLEKEFVVVINRHGIGDDGVDLYCKEENIRVVARIPNDRKIAETYSRGELLYPVIPSVRSAVGTIADYIGEFERGMK